MIEIKGFCKDCTFYKSTYGVYGYCYYWEYEQGYPQGTKTMVSYIWNEETGLRSTWYSNI